MTEFEQLTQVVAKLHEEIERVKLSTEWVFRILLKMPDFHLRYQEEVKRLHEEHQKQQRKLILPS